MQKWYKKPGTEQDVVVSTRVRLARNLKDFPFPARLDLQGREKVNALIKEAVNGNNTQKKFSYINMENLDNIQALSLAEQHLISPEFAKQRKGRALLLGEEDSVSIMLNEEDHIRLQVLCSGMNPDEAYSEASQIDDLLDSRLQYAFDENLGYLTQCPTNLGTGMRASVMLHLPALQEQRRISELSNTVSKLGLTIRGTYGEGTQSVGAFYQLSNQVTLGISEKAALENLRGITSQIILQERKAREAFMKNPAFADRIWRAAGILKYARRINHDEFMQMASLVRLGAACGIFPVPVGELDVLINTVQPATLVTAEPEAKDAAVRDEKRAQRVRECLKNI